MLMQEDPNGFLLNLHTAIRVWFRFRVIAHRGILDKLAVEGFVEGAQVVPIQVNVEALLVVCLRRVKASMTVSTGVIGWNTCKKSAALISHLL